MSAVHTPIVPPIGTRREEGATTSRFYLQTGPGFETSSGQASGRQSPERPSHTLSRAGPAANRDLRASGNVAGQQPGMHTISGFENAEGVLRREGAIGLGCTHGIVIEVELVTVMHQAGSRRHLQQSLPPAGHQ